MPPTQTALPLRWSARVSLRVNLRPSAGSDVRCLPTLVNSHMRTYMLLRKFEMYHMCLHPNAQVCLCKSIIFSGTFISIAAYLTEKQLNRCK